MQPENGKNMGVIIEVKDTDFIVGGESGVIYEIRNESGDWEGYKPTDEWQRRRYKNKMGYDSYSCVTFSALNIIEMQIRYLLEHGKFTEEQVKFLNENGYIDENGYPNFNDWFTAVMSGTTENGNSGQKVWDSIRKDGLLPQSKGHQIDDFETRSEYLSTLPSQEQKDEAKGILEVIQVVYEWVVVGQSGQWEKIEKHLKHAPLHIFTPVCGSWNTRPPKQVTDCGKTDLDHATAYIGQSKGNFHKDLDHYEPFIKNLAWNYYIPYAIKAVVEPVKEKIKKDFKYKFNINLRFGQGESEEVRKLQEALQFLGYMTDGVFGPYGPQTKKAVEKFQIAHGIEGDKGVNFGPRTRGAMNDIIK